MRTVARGVVIVLVMVGCGGGSSLVPEPAGVVAVEDLVGTSVGDLVNTIEGFFDLQLVLTDPEAAIAAGIIFEPDPQGPVNQFLFEFPYDSDGDGTDDATASGTILIPILPGATGTLDFDTVDPDGTGEGTLQFEFVPGGAQLWGSGMTTDTASGINVEFEIPMATPITIDTDPVGEGNLCGADIEGPLELTATGPLGVYELVLLFIAGSLDVEALDRIFSAAGSSEQQFLPNDTMSLPACTDLTLDDWVGTWTLNWTCIPLEGGVSTVTFTRTGANTLEVDDDGLGVIFEATADANDPRVLRGFFIDSDSAGTYREDFVFKLQPDGQSWIQDNSYEYLSGPAAGTTGNCGGVATPVP